MIFAHMHDIRMASSLALSPLGAVQTTRYAHTAFHGCIIDLSPALGRVVRDKIARKGNDDGDELKRQYSGVHYTISSTWAPVVVQTTRPEYILYTCVLRVHIVHMNLLVLSILLYFYVKIQVKNNYVLSITKREILTITPSSLQYPIKKIG